MATDARPTLREILQGYRRFNQWQEAEEQRFLPHLSVAESLNQFFELCDFVRPWRPGPGLELQWLEEERAGWTDLLNREREQRKAEGDAGTA